LAFGVWRLAFGVWRLAVAGGHRVPDEDRADSRGHFSVEQQREEDDQDDLPVQHVGKRREVWVHVGVRLLLDDEGNERHGEHEYSR